MRLGTWLAWGTLAALAASAGCGESGDLFKGSGASGAGASSSSSGAGGSGGSAAGGSGGEAGSGASPGTPCQWGDDCASGEYCDAPGCEMGTCVTAPDPSQQTKEVDPVCGCDGVGYLNPSMAATKGIAVAHAGRCEGEEALKCTMLEGCPPGMYCNKQVEDAFACSINDGSGSCWVVPTGCDTTTAKGVPCLGSGCADVCSLVQSQNPWYLDSNVCP